jgi:hypothetical protein
MTDQLTYWKGMLARSDRCLEGSEIDTEWKERMDSVFNMSGILGMVLYGAVAYQQRQWDDMVTREQREAMASLHVCLTARRKQTEESIDAGTYPDDVPHYRLDVISNKQPAVRSYDPGYGRSIAAMTADELRPTEEEQRALDLLEDLVRWRIVHVSPLDF